MPLVHDLLKLPDAVRKGDFVQGLSDGIENPEKTVDDYAITPKIVQTFDHALSIVGSALEDRRSQAAYLHGSFGSGKSHFMALLDLMVDGHPAPWRREDFHVLRDKHPWLGKKKVLQLPIHMLGAQDMESKILGTYVQWVAEHHPDAPVPAVFVDEGLFDDARGLRSTLGDDAFFTKLNGGVQKARQGWGQLGAAQARTWNAVSFEDAAGGRYVGEAAHDANSPRARLFSDLVRTFFQSWTSQKSRFVDLDRGLGILSRHASTLEYDAVILYLDELVLWLAGNSSDLPFVGREVQKMVKLKEAQDADRAVPIVSFIARQRDLSQFLGEQAQGAVRAELTRALSHHEGRFEQVTLADSNLPAIVSHRVVRPRDDSASQMLKDDFARTWRSAGQAQSVLIGSDGDEAAFRQVYPFSPALVEALVILSGCLQRERTAIRILMELLVHHLPDLPTGRVVPVGDAFDALAESGDPIDDPVMKARFDRARDLYREGFLPLIRRTHGTDSSEACQRMQEGHDRRLGCSGCPQTQCRNDNRLVKTLLMAALVPEAKPFKGLTIKQLVHLNHGTIASPIPGAEMQVAAQRLREWSSQVGALRLGDQADPEVSLHLAGVDLQPIIAQAADVNQSGQRKQMMRRLLFQALGVQADGSIVELDAPFHGTRRRGRIRYGNVREMDDGALTCPDHLEWQVILDYPFDERGHGPDEDLIRVEKYRDAHLGDSPNPTVVWLPTFFSYTLEQELGDLVVIEHIIDGDQQRYLGHLRVEDQATARADLASLRAQKEALIKRSLAQAYGLTSPGDSGLLDPSRSVDEHLVPLLDGLDIRAVLAGNMGDGRKQITDAILTRRYPHHPRFQTTVTVSRTEKVLELVDTLLDRPDGRMGNLETHQRKDLRDIADPLGITQTSDVSVLLQQRPLRDLEQLRQQQGLDAPSVATVRGWLDPDGNRGLVPEVQDLLISLYATWSGRTFERGGRLYERPRPGQLADDAVLTKPPLPTPAEWHEALDRAGHLFGLTVSRRTLNVRNVTDFAHKLRQKADEQANAEGLVPALETRVTTFADPSDAPRLQTARHAAALLASMRGLGGTDLVKALANYGVGATKLTSMGRSLSTATAARRLLSEEARWIVFRQVQGLTDDPQLGHRATLLLEDLDGLLSEDEVNRMLADGLADLTQRAGTLLKSQAPTPPEPPPSQVVLDVKARDLSAADALTQLRQIMETLEADGEGATVELRVRAWRKDV